MQTNEISGIESKQLVDLSGINIELNYLVTTNIIPTVRIRGFFFSTNLIVQAIVQEALGSTRVTIVVE